VPIAERMQKWVAEQRALSGRLPRRYASIEDALKRMQEANGHLSPEQARHLTRTASIRTRTAPTAGKFDNYVRADSPYGMTKNEIEELWGRIKLPDPPRLRQGKLGLGLQPRGGRPPGAFPNAKVVAVDGAGHWVHHDRLQVF